MNKKTSQFTPLQDDSPSSSIKRFNNQVAPMQFVREAVQNAIEAGAKKVTIERCPLYLKTQKQTEKLRIVDNGGGMTPDELLKYINKYNSSSKLSKGRHDNFGIGIKATAANFNRYGLVFVSWSAGGDGHMIWLCYNEQYQQFGVRHIDIYEMDDDGDLITVPKQVVSLEELKASYPNGFEGIEWWNCNNVNFQKRIKGQGTMVYFLGNSRDQDTWAIDSRGSSVSTYGYLYYLSTRYWDTQGTRIVTSLFYKETDDYYNSMTIASMHQNIGFLKYRSVARVKCGRGFQVHVFIRDNPLSIKELKNSNRLQTSKHTNGFMAIKYNNELYNHEWGKIAMRKWGIIADEVMSQVKLIVIPPVYDPKTGYGVFPNEGRDTLLIENPNRVDIENKYIDLERIREEFIDNHPQELTDLINEALAKKTAKSHDGHEVLKRYGHLFKLHKAKGKEDAPVCDTDGDGQHMLPGCPPESKTKEKKESKKEKAQREKEEKIKERLQKLKNSNNKPKAKRHPTRVIWEMPTRDDDCKFRGQDGFEYPFAFSRTKEGPIIWGNEDHEYLKSIEHYFADYYKGGEGQRPLIAATIEDIAGLQATCVHAHKMQLAKAFPQLRSREQVSRQEFFAKLLGGDLHSKVQQALSKQGLKAKKTK
jgi:hypothetical protein